MSALESASRITAGSTDLDGWREVASKDAKEALARSCATCGGILKAWRYRLRSRGGLPASQELPSRRIKIYSCRLCRYASRNPSCGFQRAGFHPSRTGFQRAHRARRRELVEGRGSNFSRASPSLPRASSSFSPTIFGARSGELGSLDGCMAVFSRYIRNLTPAIVFRQARVLHRDIRARRNKRRFPDAYDEHIFEISAASGVFGTQASEAENDATMACLTKAAFPGKRAIRWLMGVEHLKQGARARTFA